MINIDFFDDEASLQADIPSQTVGLDLMFGPPGPAGNKIFVQSSAPTGQGEVDGDIWIKTP